MRRAVLCGMLAGCVACVLVGCGRQESLRIGSKAFTESVILAELARGAAASQGTAVQHIRELGGTQVVWNGLQAGEIDLYPEYTGTILREILADPGLSTEEMTNRLRKQGIRVSPPLGFNNSYAIGMRRERAAALGITQISDLAAHPQLKLGFSNEFLHRGDGWPGLRDHYRLPQRDVIGLEHVLAYRAVASGDLDAVDVYTTDPQILADDLIVLEDDRTFFPRYDAVFLYRESVPDKYPAALAGILMLAGQISEMQMTRLNASVQLEQRTEQSVTAEFLGEVFSIRTAAAVPTLWLRIFHRTREHLWLVGVSLLAAIGVAVPLGVVAHRRRRLGVMILGIAEVIQTIPGLALLVLIAVLFVQIGLPMISSWPAIVALFLYSLLPILRNTQAGLAAISPSLRESAEVLGLSWRSRLWRIELPLAAPLILAGIKTTAVINVGYAALGGLIGAGGYGQPIMAGLRSSNTALMLEGAIPAALLALLVKLVFSGLERVLISPGLRTAGLNRR